MKAIGYQTAHPIDHPESLLDITQPDPVATGHDLLVEVHAVSVNPVDTKVRKSSSRSGDGPDYKVLGWDASGIVRAVGPEVTLFQPGDRVWYAGSIARPGTNSELHLVDERIVGHAPKSLDFAEAAALPLTTITAWELLFDRLGVAPGTPGVQPGVVRLQPRGNLGQRSGRQIGQGAAHRLGLGSRGAEMVGGAAQFGQQRQHLLLNRYIQSRSGLIQDQNLRPQHQRTSNCNALTLPSRKFMGVALQSGSI